MTLFGLMTRLQEERECLSSISEMIQCQSYTHTMTLCNCKIGGGAGGMEQALGLFQTSQNLRRITHFSQTNIYNNQGLNQRQYNEEKKQISAFIKNQNSFLKKY